MCTTQYRTTCVQHNSYVSFVTTPLQVIENQCLQDLMYNAVHAPRTGVRSLFHCLHTVLACVHKHITQRNVIMMLVKLYGPFLWRSLNVCDVHMCLLHI